jgi:hypothetical protein
LPGDKFFQIIKKTLPESLTLPSSFIMTVYDSPDFFSSAVILTIPFLDLVLFYIGAFKV